MATTNKNEDAAITAANNAAKVSTIKGGSIAKPITAKRPVLSGLELGDKYDIQYNQDYILDLLDKATAAEYNSKRQEFAATENKFYNELYDTQASALDAIRASNSAAVATGATKGMAAAQQLAAILGLEQTSVESATDLANKRNELAAKEAEAYAKNANTALETSNTLKNAIAEAALNKYGYDTQGYVGALEYNAALQSVLGEIIQSQNAAAATMYNADRNLAGTQYAADKNSGRYNIGTKTGNGNKTGNGTKTGNGNKTGNSNKTTHKTTAAEEEANQRDKGNTKDSVVTKTYNGKSYKYNTVTGMYVYNGKTYTTKAKLEAAIDAGLKGKNGQKNVDAATREKTDQADQGNSSASVVTHTYNGKTYYYNKTTGMYVYNNKVYTSESALKAALAKDTKNKNKNKKVTPKPQQNHSTTGTINQIKWL